MTQDSLHERGSALENAFFKHRDNELLKKLKAELTVGDDRTALASATGIDDEAVLSKLIEQGISVETLAGLGLIPLIAVAWADGKMDDDERVAILKAARETGITEEMGSYDLISGWLNQRPGDDLLESWKQYVKAMRLTLDETALGQIKNSVITRAKTVANSAGGFLGINKTSGVEQDMIDILEATFG